MKKIIYLGTLFTLLVSTVISCSKKEKSVDTPIVIDSFSPDTALTGYELQLNGTFPGSEPGAVDIIIDGKTYSNTTTPDLVSVSSATNIKFIFPRDVLTLPGSLLCNISVVIKGKESNKIAVPLKFQEPSGWYFVTKNAPADFFQVTFASPQLGFLYADNKLFKTQDGGYSWVQDQQITPESDMLSSATFATYDGVHSWIGCLNEIWRKTTEASPWTIMRPADQGVTGLYMSSATTGLMMTQDGHFSKVDADAAVPETPLFYAGPGKIFRKLSAIDEHNFVATGWQSSAYIDYIVKCVNGVVTEQVNPIPLQDMIDHSKYIQMMDANVFYIIDNESRLIKYTGNNGQVVRQGAKAAWFKDAQNGYMYDDEQIRETNNGGQTWQSIFTLPQGYDVIAMTGKNSILWCYGFTDTNSGFILKLNQ